MRKCKKGLHYFEGPQCKECHRNWRQSEQGKVSKRISVTRYQKSEHGRTIKNETVKRRYWRDPDYHRAKKTARRYGINVTALQQILERDKVCKRCSTDTDLTFDHIIPVSKGGKGTVENLQILCRPCNTIKGNK